MKFYSKVYPTGVPYIELVCDATWHTFPELAEQLLKSIQATDVQCITKGQVVDAHCYQFHWQGSQYQLFFDDWPHQCSIESLENEIGLGKLFTVLVRLEGDL